MEQPTFGRTDARKGKQNPICCDSCRQFIDDYQLYQGYSDEVRQEDLVMYVNGMGLRGIKRVKGVVVVPHTTAFAGVKTAGNLLPDADNLETTPTVGELDKRETFSTQNN